MMYLHHLRGGEAALPPLVVVSQTTCVQRYCQLFVSHKTWNAQDKDFLLVWEPCAVS